METVMSRVVEILLYKLKPGTGGDFQAIMRDVSAPLHRRHGIDVVWHGPSMHDPDGYGLIRAFPDAAAMETTLAAFYASDDWRQGPRESVVSRIDVATKLVMPLQAVVIEGLRQHPPDADVIAQLPR